ncbi:MAG: 4-alpha-glucanotransferase [Candidatus Sedimenticola sp. 6PFRAG5]
MTSDVYASSLQQRQAGVLLHVTSLPGRGVTGDLGPEAFHFVDFLSGSGIGIWQMLPIGPTQSDGSPYQSSSMHAGNPRLIAIEPLVDAGWLNPALLEQGDFSDQDKQHALELAWTGFEAGANDEQRAAFSHFLQEHGYWLEDYALYRALHEAFDYSCWWDWPAELRDRQPEALEKAREHYAKRIDFTRFEQYLFCSQWFAIKAYANERGIKLFGDMPIFVAHDSAEVWAHRDMFLLDETGHPTVVAGVPPDYFSETGQRWGNPLYNWESMSQDGYSFWIDRMKTQLNLFDVVRIDHFRGFEAYWEIPAHEEFAINGQWVKAPGDELFEKLHDIYDPLPLVAEDLGIITPEVDALRKKFGLPGMKILQFAFSGDSNNPYLPFRHETDSVVYTGTHDNDTTLGWYNSQDAEMRQYVDEFLGFSWETMPWPMIRSALASRSNLAVIPMQDLLSLGGRHRMNLPGTTEGNWEWRFDWSMVDDDLAERVSKMVKMYSR